jgi:hypothetical protein
MVHSSVAAAETLGGGSLPVSCSSLVSMGLGGFTPAVDVTSCGVVVMAAAAAVPVVALDCAVVIEGGRGGGSADSLDTEREEVIKPLPTESGESKEQDG